MANRPLDPGYNKLKADIAEQAPNRVDNLHSYPCEIFILNDNPIALLWIENKGAPDPEKWILFTMWDCEKSLYCNRLVAVAKLKAEIRSGFIKQD